MKAELTYWHKISYRAHCVDRQDPLDLPSDATVEMRIRVDVALAMAYQSIAMPLARLPGYISLENNVVAIRRFHNRAGTSAS